MSDPSAQAVDGPERRSKPDRRADPSAERRKPRPSRTIRWLGIAWHELALLLIAIFAVIFAVRRTEPIFANHPEVAAALRDKAPVAADAMLKPSAADTNRRDQIVRTPQFEADRKKFAADLMATGRITQGRADSIAYYAVRESYLHGIPPAVVFGVMLTENSRFISNAKSDVGAVGIMQVYPKVWLKELGNKFGRDLATDSTNLKYGVYILKQYIKTDSGAVSRTAVGKGLLKYNGCVRGSHTPGCASYSSKVKVFVERQAEAMCGDKDFYECIARPFLTGLTGNAPTGLRPDEAS